MKLNINSIQDRFSTLETIKQGDPQGSVWVHYFILHI